MGAPQRRPCLQAEEKRAVYARTMPILKLFIYNEVIYLTYIRIHSVIIDRVSIVLIRLQLVS